MSSSVFTLPVRNFKFLTEGCLGRTRNYHFREKEVASGEVSVVSSQFSVVGWQFLVRACLPGNGMAAMGLFSIVLVTVHRLLASPFPVLPPLSPIVLVVVLDP